MTRRSNFLTTVICLATATVLIVTAGGHFSRNNLSGDETLPAAGESAAIQVPTSAPLVDLVAPLKASRRTEQQIQQALKNQVTFRLREATWDEFSKQLAEISGAHVLIDEKAFLDADLSDERITADYENVKLKNVLQWILEPIEADWIVEDEILKISTWSEIESNHLRHRAYDVSGLLKAGYDSIDLTDVVLEGTSGPWEAIDGEGGTLLSQEKSLVARTVPRTHQEIERLLTTMAVAADDVHAGSILGIHPDDVDLYQCLEERISVDYQATSLQDVVTDLQKQTGVRIHLDEKSFREEGLDFEEPIDWQISNVTVNSVLRLILDPLECGVALGHSRLLITPESVASESHETFVYNVKDLAKAGYDEENLSDIITEATTGPWESVDGEGGGDPMMPLSGVLVVRQSLRAQQETALLLSDLRAALPQQAAKAEPTRDPNAIRTEVYKGLTLPADDLVKAIPQFIAPESWQANDGAGTILQMDVFLVIRQTEKIHQEIRAFLKKLEKEAAKSDINTGFF